MGEGEGGRGRGYAAAGEVGVEFQLPSSDRHRFSGPSSWFSAGRASQMMSNNQVRSWRRDAYPLQVQCVVEVVVLQQFCSRVEAKSKRLAAKRQALSLGKDDVDARRHSTKLWNGVEHRRHRQG